MDNRPEDIMQHAPQNLKEYDAEALLNACIRELAEVNLAYRLKDAEPTLKQIQDERARIAADPKLRREALDIYKTVVEQGLHLKTLVTPKGFRPYDSDGRTMACIREQADANLAARLNGAEPTLTDIQDERRRISADPKLVAEAKITYGAIVAKGLHLLSDTAYQGTLTGKAGISKE